VVRGGEAGGVHDEAKSEFVVDGIDDGLFHPQQIPIQGIGVQTQDNGETGEPLVC
jgi:hypothetical protein